MSAFQNPQEAVDELPRERMHVRVKPQIKQAIQRAAALSGVDDSMFIENAAYRSSLEVIAAHERTLLQSADHAAFFAALEQRPEPTTKLRAAFTRHRKTVVSR
jgi:uncharacterized protein (DUF1778 family)